MPRYEFNDGSSKKFWEIALEGTSFTTTYGRLGTDGQSSLKEYESEEKAKKEYEKLILEKTKKGYLLVSGGGASPAPIASAPASPAPAISAAVGPALSPLKVSAPSPEAKQRPVFDDEGDEDEAPANPAPKPTPEAPAAPTPIAMAAPPTAAAAPAATASAGTPTRSSKGDTAGARYFEFIDGSSSKFWEIALEGTSFTTRYGKIGTEGQQSLKEYDSTAKAESEAQKLVAEKTKKGYVEK